MWSLTWVGVSGSISGCRNTQRMASVNPISCPAPAAPSPPASACFNSLIRLVISILLAISGSPFHLSGGASCSTIGPQCEICSLISVSCFSSSRNLSRADSYIFKAVSSGIKHLYTNVHKMSIVISPLFIQCTPARFRPTAERPGAKS